MAQVIDKMQFRFFIASKGDDKKLRSLLFRHKHTHTHRTDLDYDAIIFYAPSEKSVVTPLLYGAKAIEGVKMNLELDREWIKLYRSHGRTFPKIGIGRGAHFLNVMNGGSEWQKVKGHNEAKLSHDIRTPDGELYVAPSFHETAMMSANHAQVIAHANSSTYLADSETVFTDIDEWGDEEIVFYESTRSLCIEPPPETLGYPQYTSLAMKIIEKACIP